MLGVILLWICATILWWSGWRDEAAEGIPQWAVGIFLAGWAFTLLLQIKLNSTQVVNGAWVWTLLAFICLTWSIPSTRRWTSLSGGVLLGSVYLLLNRLSYYPSIGSHFFHSWVLAMVLGCLCALLLRNASEQLVAVTASLFLSEGITEMILNPTAVISLVQAADWMQSWWIAVLCARLLSVSISSMKTVVNRWAHHMGWSRGGQRS